MTCMYHLQGSSGQCLIHCTFQHDWLWHVCRQAHCHAVWLHESMCTHHFVCRRRTGLVSWSEITVLLDSAHTMSGQTSGTACDVVLSKAVRTRICEAHMISIAWSGNGILPTPSFRLEFCLRMQLCIGQQLQQRMSCTAIFESSLAYERSCHPKHTHGISVDESVHCNSLPLLAQKSPAWTNGCLSIAVQQLYSRVRPHLWSSSMMTSFSSLALLARSSCNKSIITFMLELCIASPDRRRKVGR